jgi:hypothetical protein
MKSFRGSIGIPAIFQHVVGKGADGVEIAVGVGWGWLLVGKTDREMGKEQYGEHE